MSHSNKSMNRYSSRNDWYQDPSDAYDVGQNWCISVPYHELKLMEEARKLAKRKNCKSVAQLVRKVMWKEIRKEKELLAA